MKKNNKKDKTKNKKIVWFQIILLVVSIIAITWIIGSSIERVDAEIVSGTATYGFATNSFGGAFATAAVYAYAAALAWVFIWKAAGASERNSAAMMSAAWIVGASAAIVATAIATVIGSTTMGTLAITITAGLAIPGVGWIAAAIALTAMMVFTAISYKGYSQELFVYQVGVWQPPERGENCLKCNNLEFGCSEYQCSAFGEACVIENKGTKDELCIWKNPDDIRPPLLTPMKEVLEEGYAYTPSQAILPTERGVKIVYLDGNNGCVPPFSQIIIGVNTSEPAECKIDVERKPSFDNLISYMSEGPVNTYNHTVILPSSATPSQSASEGVGWDLDDGKEYMFFLMCKDANGNSNPLNFIMEFCVEQGPDTMAPIIKGTSFTTNPAYIQSGVTDSPVEVYTNEPADCRWDFQDLDYDSMNYNMTNCSQDVSNYFYPQTFTYGCQGNLTGIQNQDSTKYHIKCKDQPWLEQEDPFARNANVQSYKLILLGAPPLQIDEILINDKPNNAIIKDATDVIPITLKVKTSAGALEGQAVCSYNLGEDFGFVQFIETGTAESTQNIWLEASEEGTLYEIPIKCEDVAGNTANDTAIFTLQKDVVAPEVTRVYYETGKLKIITNEPAECVYSILTSCNYGFEDGTEIQSSAEGLEHFLDWDTEIDMYVKCRDTYGNQPIVNDQYVCSIVVRGADPFSG